MDVVLVKTGLGDAEAVSRMAYDIIPGVYPHIGSEVIQNYIDTNQSPEIIRSRMEAGQLYLLVRSGSKNLGYVAYYIEGDVLHLDKLYLYPQSRGAGAGSLVLRTMVEKACSEGCSSVLLDVHGRNQRARKFYERHGFVYDREIPNGTDVPDWTMRLDLRPHLRSGGLLPSATRQTCRRP